MNKTELAHDVALRAHLSRAEGTAAVNQVFEILQERIAIGEDVQILGFGTFSLRHKPAHQGHNPKTGLTVHVHAKNSPHFKAGATLKAGVNRK